MATPIRPAAAAPPARRPPSPSPLPPPPLPLPHHDTTLTLALPLPPPPTLVCISPRQPVPRPAPGGGVVVARAPRPPSLTEDTPPTPCSECGKEFPSWKALFGHMRCHPERQWRGIRKPPHVLRHRAVADLQFTEQERETATSLLMLRQGGEPGSGKGKKSILGAAKVSCGGASTSSASSSPLRPRCDDHKCSVCARGFATGQALGGHKRCHWEKTACAEGTATAVATSSSDAFISASSSQAAPPATTLDLNLPPPGMPPLPN